MITKDWFSSILDQNIQALPLKDALLEQFSDFAEREIYGVFTRHGLDSLCRDGILKGQIGAFLPPFQPVHRQKLLQNMLDRPSDHHRYMLSEDITLPAHMNFEIYGNSQINMIRIDEDLHISFFIINESSICDAFLDFASALFESDLVLSEAETDQYIRKKLKEL